MKERIFIGVAWPYANGPLHLGHIAGCYLPADIFARYHRIKGNEVLMVSGSDQHGTPITLQAEQEGKTPAEIASKYHQQFLECWEKLGISFDLFTRTTTVNHAEVTHDIFLALYNKGYIYKGTMSLPYCPTCQRFLPDRYVEGTCPYCDYPGARGDQCDRCGKPLNPAELRGIRCRHCGATPQMRDSEHLFLKLTAFRDGLLGWVKTKSHWRSNVLNFTYRYLEEGLKDRAITRDIDWGVTVPLPGFDDKRIYVWFEAVIGYLSASKEWSRGKGDPELWRRFWQEPVRSYYFIGKDNIPFHTIIWPAMITGYGGLDLPYDVPANEFLTLEGEKLSTSRRWAVWLPDYLASYAAEPLRYYLSANMPETSDADFSWVEFYRRNNNELVATYGNLVHRVLSFTYRSYQGRVPDPGAPDEASQALVQKARDTLETVDNHLYHCHFREAVRAAMALAQATNRYLDDTSPWKTIKTDAGKASLALYTAIHVIAALKTALYPVLPFSSQSVHNYLGFSGKVEDQGWHIVPPTPGQQLQSPSPLFVKLEETEASKEKAKLGILST
ncbi:MAG: methionine--tRNA ligase [Chloroflexi bacterium]|nr:methionine--tRNA ligase [Chloroflexota bacterium]